MTRSRLLHIPLAAAADFLRALFGALAGAAAGLIVGLFSGDAVLDVIAQWGLHDIALWQFGGLLGFTAAFFKPETANR